MDLRAQPHVSYDLVASDGDISPNWSDLTAASAECDSLNEFDPEGRTWAIMRVTTTVLREFVV